MKKEIKYEPVAIIENEILLIRGIKVILDSDLAKLYQVATKNLNKAVSRNRDRFPVDFCFQLTHPEMKNLRFQFGTSSSDYGGKRYLPYVFTEHGVAMLSSVLRSKRAVHMNIFIIRAFVKLREMLAAHKDMANKIEELERGQKENSEEISKIYSIVKRLTNEPLKPSGKMGFSS